MLTSREREDFRRRTGLGTGVGRVATEAAFGCRPRVSPVTAYLSQDLTPARVAWLQLFFLLFADFKMK